MDSSALINCVNQLVEQNSALMKKIALLEADRDAQPLIPGRSSAEDNTELRAELEFLKEELRRLKEDQENRDSRLFSALCTVLTEENVTVANELKLITERIEGQEVAAEKMMKEVFHSQILKLTEENTTMRTELEDREDDVKLHSAKIQSLKELIERKTNSYDQYFAELNNWLTEEGTTIRAELESQQAWQLKVYKRLDNDRSADQRKLRELINQNTANFTQQSAHITRMADEARSTVDEVSNLSSRINSLEEELQKQQNIREQSEGRQLTMEIQNVKSDDNSSTVNCTIQFPQLPETIDLLHRFLNKKLHKKYVLLSDFYCQNIMSSHAVEHIHPKSESYSLNEPNLPLAPEFYNNELLVLTTGDDGGSYSLSVRNSQKDLHDRLLKFCETWKKVKPDGAIHCIYSLGTNQTLGLSEELMALFTTSHRIEPNNGSLAIPIRQYWPQFADHILSYYGRSL